MALWTPDKSPSTKSLCLGLFSTSTFDNRWLISCIKRLFHWPILWATYYWKTILCKRIIPIPNKIILWFLKNHLIHFFWFLWIVLYLAITALNTDWVIWDFKPNLSQISKFNVWLWKNCLRWCIRMHNQKHSYNHHDKQTWYYPGLFSHHELQIFIFWLEL